MAAPPLAALHAAWETARDLARRERTPATRAAAQAAWTALVAASPAQTPGPDFGRHTAAARSGRRQHAALRAAAALKGGR